MQFRGHTWGTLSNDHRLHRPCDQSALKTRVLIFTRTSGKLPAPSRREHSEMDTARLDTPRDSIMMTSMFSFFDAVCAESNGWKFGFSLAPSPAKEERSKVSTSLSSTEVNKKEKAGGSSPPVNAKRTEHQQQKSNPRFAPELDGVHCFETIVPY
ncbi:hypothetical protein L1049_019492 [Liquidambar formosana]|uniref:Uncharacterized protein n=1 Tax=Liquidambar formosana TaxID=63359 RepID=A0AAP0SCN9_LIQFO